MQGIPSWWVMKPIVGEANAIKFLLVIGYFLFTIYKINSVITCLSNFARENQPMPEATRMRIQYVIATLDRAGAEGQLTALLTRLDRTRFEPHLVCLTRGGPHASSLEAAGVPYEIIGKTSKLDLRPLGRLYRHLRRFRPHVLHTWMFTANAFGRAAGILARVPVRIASERAVDTWKTWPYHLADRVLAPWTHCIVANCEAVRKFVEHHVPLDAARLCVIPNGVDTRRFLPREHGPADPVTFCAIGRLAPQKRMDLVLKALAGLGQHGVRARLLILGEGPLAGELHALAESLGVAPRVEWRGAVDDVTAALLESDVFVLASDWEGMPNVALEAMASGLPVVATAVDGSVELVKDCETGLLTRPGDAAGLAAAMERCATSAELRQRLGRTGRMRAESEFSMDRMVERYQSLYERLGAGINT